MPYYQIRDSLSQHEWRCPGCHIIISGIVSASMNGVIRNTVLPTQLLASSSGRCQGKLMGGKGDHPCQTQISQTDLHTHAHAHTLFSGGRHGNTPVFTSEWRSVGVAVTVGSAVNSHLNRPSVPDMLDTLCFIVCCRGSRPASPQVRHAQPDGRSHDLEDAMMLRVSLAAVAYLTATILARNKLTHNTTSDRAFPCNSHSTPQPQLLPHWAVLCTTMTCSVSELSKQIHPLSNPVG
ncbi:hypothetical protein RRG08_022412 [Elysia crispata]|uniref:Uncharacterized protein n=1 Tax=Elysia crispata TaxID=231223 RepID=A0AAE0Z1R6_9GAST|nr:hypothetical protein RRG08_022412 [Elysia crispata]